MLHDHRWRLLCAVTAICGLLDIPASPDVVVGAEGDVVTVSLRDGRILTGVVDAKTDAAELWLHSAEPSILVLTSRPWTEVRSARIAGQMLSVETFREEARQSKSPIPLATFRQAAEPHRPTTIRPPDRIQSLSLFAQIANWDRDAESDGLELRVDPLTSDGSSVAIDGWLTIRLLGRCCGTLDIRTVPPAFGFWTDGTPTAEYSPRHRDERFLELGRWTERVRADRFTAQGAIVRVPFRHIHPDHDLDVATDAIVECRLNVRGQGIYHATAPIELRAFAPLRDTLQERRGTRFFPDELKSR